MLRVLTVVIGVLLWTPNLTAQAPQDATNGNDEALSPSVPAALSTADLTSTNGIGESGNRLPLLLRDVKVLLSEAMMADVAGDTLEVVYSLDRIFELLAEADQLGEMTAQDREEFDRFEHSLMDLYTRRFQTLDKTDVAITADQVRTTITEFVEPLEVEMGTTQYTVVDDRDGHIPLVRNKKVDQFIKFFQTKGKKQFQIWLDRYAQIGPLLQEILAEEDLPEELVFVAMVESGLNPVARSRANAVGIWQFIYSTGKKYNLNRNWYVDERRDPIKATHAACNHFRDLYREFDHWYLALSAYNSGEGRVKRAIRLHQTTDFWQLHSLPRETRNYIPYFLAAAIIGQSPDQYGFAVSTQPQNLFEYEPVSIEKSADLTVLARSAGISLKTLKHYNPELRQSATPAEGSYALRLPKGHRETFITNFTALPEGQRFAPQNIVHRVKRGESLWTLSKRYKVSIHDLAAVNKIKNRHKIRIGQKLTIPLKGVLIQGKGPPEHYQVVYRVKRGDTLGHIAENYGTRANHLRRWNNLNYGQYIFPGQKLIIWVKS